MTCSTSSSIDAVFAWGLLALLLLSGCALMRGAPGPPLEFESLTRDGAGTLRAGDTTVRWTAGVSGGAGEPTYEFRTRRGDVEIIEQVGPASTWEWRPDQAGAFAVKVTVEDSSGAKVDSGWLSDIVVTPAVAMGAPIAVLPVENLSGGRAPLREIADLMRSQLGERGFQLVEERDLERFMHRNRVRNTAGLSSQKSRAIREETGAAAYLVTTLETFQTLNPPKVSLIARLVSSGEQPKIVWMDGIGLSGEGYPGFLGLGIVEDPEVLLVEAVHCLVESLDRSLREAAEPKAADANLHYGCDPRGDVVAQAPDREGKKKHRPRSYYRSPRIDAEKRYTVAVIPFLNLSHRKNAGEIVALQFVNQLVRTANLAIVEPGLVREQLLKYRIIMQAGPSLANAEIISSENSLRADLVFSGTVFDYQDSVGVPKVDFSVKIIEAASRMVVWSSRNHNDGDEGVFFFDFGRVYTAHRLVADMAWGTFEVLARGDATPSRYLVDADARGSQ